MVIIFCNMFYLLFIHTMYKLECVIILFQGG